MNDENCCAISCNKQLDQTYWNNRYKSNSLGWDLGEVSPTIKTYIDTIKNKNTRILIPGCGNSYEAGYLLQQDFKNITIIDISPFLVENLKNKFGDNKNITVVLGDFFSHQGIYDYIIEQTFFCALHPSLRQRYVWKTFQLLAADGKLVGLLFNHSFVSGPPFGGSKEEYLQLFKASFVFNKIETAKNSILPRANTELFIEFQKNDRVLNKLYIIEGITCSSCMETVKGKFRELEGVKNVSMNTDFTELLIISLAEIPNNELQNVLSYDQNYRISTFI